MQLIFEPESTGNDVSTEESSVTPSAELLFGKLFHCRDVAYLIHLRTSPAINFGLHIAMEEFYKKILKLTDKLVETYSGLHGIPEIEIDKSEYEEPVAYMWEVYGYIQDHREVFKESWIQNQIDEIQALVAHTLYKIVDKKVRQEVDLG